MHVNAQRKHTVTHDMNLPNSPKNTPLHILDLNGPSQHTSIAQITITTISVPFQSTLYSTVDSSVSSVSDFL